MASIPELLIRAQQWSDRRALVAPEGEFTYGELSAAAERGAARLVSSLAASAGTPDVDAPPRVCLLAPWGWDFTATQWAAWRAGTFLVPLAVSHPEPELAFVLDDAQASAVVVHPSMLDRIQTLANDRGIPLWTTEALLADGSPDGGGGVGDGLGGPGPVEDQPALMLYTSGTTGRPKGVVHTHGSLAAQMVSMSEAWGWAPIDHALLTLPLHHVHGLINVLGTALWNGACVTVLPAFDAEEVWKRLASGDITLFMGVPTQYDRLLTAHSRQDIFTRDKWAEGSRTCRLMVSGSAALPVSTLGRWEEITYQRLLERYGMTEVGMALSNLLEGRRVPGHVGYPLPGMDVRLMGKDGEPDAGDEGEIQVRGPNLFKEYWNRPEANEEAWVPADDGGTPWFRTGDIAKIGDADAYRILGRSSIDIIKTGGYKVSALEIEELLRTHPLIQDVAVVGVPDHGWGEKVSAAVVLDRVSASRLGAGGGLTLEALRAWASQRLGRYKVPQALIVMKRLPRNAMGKVQKPRVIEIFEGTDDRRSEPR